MSYRLDPREIVSAGVKRIGMEQIDRVLAQFSAKTKHRNNAIHEARKAIKRLRALLTLIRPAIGKAAAKREEERLRNVARSLSGARDVQAMMDAAAKLADFDPEIGGGAVAQQLRAHLEEQRLTADKALSGRVAAKAKKALKEARDSFAALEFEEDGFGPVAFALERNFRKARQYYQQAYRSGEDEAFHDWRKFVQRYWRHLQLISPCWPKGIQPHIVLASELSELLGDDHDISVLIGLVRSNADRLGDAETIEAYCETCRRRQGELRLAAADCGARLFAEKPSALVARLRSYWRTAQRRDKGNVPALAD